MKHIIGLSLTVLLLAVSCVSKKSADRIMDEKDALILELQHKDSVRDEILISLSTIVDNLSDIKRRENIISSNIYNGEIPKQYTTIISEDILAIDNLLQDNSEVIGSLEKNLKKLSKENMKIEGLERLSEQLREQSQQKNQQIEELKSSLSTMNIKVDELNEQIEELEISLEDLNIVNEGLSGEIRTQEVMLNTCYYMVGAEKELLSRKIVYKTGFIGRSLKINENHSLEVYTKINMNDVDNIYVGHQKAELVSFHPAGSYSFKIGGDNIVESIDIIDKALFWSVSKILLVSYK